MNLNIGIIGEPAFAREFGKKGTESDITFYNFRRGENTLSFIRPSRYPERLAPLLFTLELSDAVILEVKEINAVLGEVVLAIDSAGIRRGFIYLKNYLIPEQVKPLLKGTTLEGFKFTDLPAPELTDRLFQESPPTGTVSEGAVVPIDHFFDVKGIGPVILGVVRRGEVRKHDSLRLYPEKKTVQVRSIQTHDKDVDSAGAGERVGLALKGITVEGLDRGQVLAHETAGIRITEEPVLLLSPVPYWKKPIKEEMVVHISAFMQMRPGRVMNVEEVKSETGVGTVESGKGTVESGTVRRRFRIKVKLEKPFVYHPDERVFAAHLEGGSLRIIGSAKIVENEAGKTTMGKSGTEG